MAAQSNQSFHLNLVHRPRRLRQSSAIRRLVNEVDLSVDHLIQPLFVIEGQGLAEPIESMPGIQRFSIDKLIDSCLELRDLGIAAVALFPCIDASLKSEDAREATNPNGLILRAIRALKKALPELTIITDLALDPYTSHGHDGLLDAQKKDLLNDATVERLVEMAVLAAEADVDFVAPSDMMDGRVGAIRAALDDVGHEQVAIMAYSAKFASAFYGPFRDAVGSGHAVKEGTYLSKASYQLNPANAREAMTELMLDEKEGADVLMVKPAGPYLDILQAARQQTNRPLAAYQVSGEYAQIVAAAECGWLDLERCRDESLLAIRRAGADMILSYFAREYARSRGSDAGS